MDDIDSLFLGALNMSASNPNFAERISRDLDACANLISYAAKFGKKICAADVAAWSKADEAYRNHLLTPDIRGCFYAAYSNPSGATNGKLVAQWRRQSLQLLLRPLRHRLRPQSRARCTKSTTMRLRLTLNRILPK